MASKLIKGPGFGRSVPAIIELPYPAEQILKTVTVILKADGSVELHGAVGNLEFGQHMLDAGRARLEQWHAQMAKRKAEADAKTAAFLRSPEGVELRAAIREANGIDEAELAGAPTEDPRPA